MGNKSNVFTLTSDVILRACGKCGSPIAMPEKVWESFAESHEGFYCPMGHRRNYPGQTEAEKLTEQLAASERKRREDHERIDGLLVKLSRKDKVISRIKVRAKNGICPECNRTFKNVQRHMGNKHGDKTSA